MRYRRAYVPGGSFFFTLVMQGRCPVFASAETVDILREAFRSVRSTRPFELDAIVVLPDHLHCIWTLPPGDPDFATRWRLVKTWFTKHCDPVLRLVPDRARAARNEQALWQHRYWEHMLRDEIDFARHVEYIHSGARTKAFRLNPVKHGLVASAMDWPYSSFRQYVEAGVYPPDWGQGMMDIEGVGCE